MEVVILAIAAYLLGSIPSGLIVGKVFYKIDIREHGSGNLGGTNTFRTLGKKAGFAVTISDILKGTLATALAFWFDVGLHPLLAGMFAVIGHSFPIFAGFRGGKAVATSAGVLLMYDPLIFVLLIASFFASLYLTKYVSLSSMVAGVIGVIYASFLGDGPFLLVVSLLTAFVIIRHRTNLIRIFKREEPKIKWMG
ncbi:glycerol-3-phosphate 1-O-acyltransferase PlsY [Bacillus fonticola]|uniref:glycerol-3-phosphate 1-O-acyltransferase PlsY n=1 Tax=Bacillus fonticola TaxID=2728853 RepID=UPI00147520D4|nr:glycerol-3-phosphate 1-O-acyltransferase PlsY [Bacillus fonticola]